jgi:hypothetical protein
MSLLVPMAFRSSQKNDAEPKCELRKVGTSPPQRPLAQRLLWFVALWLGGVGTVALISFALRLWIAPK